MPTDDHYIDVELINSIVNLMKGGKGAGIDDPNTFTPYNFWYSHPALNLLLAELSVHAM